MKQSLKKGASSFEKAHDATRVEMRDGELFRTRRERPENAIVIKALLRDDRQDEKPFAEINELCRTAGAEVVEAIGQNVPRISASTYLGRGKIEEVAARAEALDVDLIVTDNDLSPGQERNLEKVLKRPVIDRSQLILDIFANRANSQQAKLQVELAQLKYTLPRLKRMWSHLSRFEGGIGMRGPGETQLETDKRIIQRRIRLLSRKLDDIERRRELVVKQRSDAFVVALVGYTNVGKSTLLNRLTSSEELVEDKLFATLDTRTRKWPLTSTRHVLVNDTVGFIRQLPHHLVASFHATLAETRSADLLFHVVDASSPHARKQLIAAHQVLRKIECADKPTWLILNKWDRVEADRQVEARNLVATVPFSEAGAPEVFELSAATGEGIEALRAALDADLDSRNRRIELVLPHARGDLLSWVCENGKIFDREYIEEGTRLDFEMSPARLDKLRAMFPAGFEPVEGEES